MSAIEACSEPDCLLVVLAKGLCQRHYERLRHRHRDDTLIKQRARQRAAARLCALYPDVYASIMDEELDRARTEASVLGKKRLMSGPRPKDQPTAEERVREDVATCARCIGYHDRGHRCEACGTEPGAGRVVPQRVAQKTPEQRIADLFRAGKSAEWIVANTGEPAFLVQRVLANLRSGAA